MRRVVLLLVPGLVAAGLLAGCGPEFDPGYRIQNERILAIRAEPPEAVPGQAVTFTPLVVSPKGTLEGDVDYGAEWWRCPDEEADGLSDEERCSRPSARVPLGEGAVYDDQIPADFFPLPDPDSGEPPSEKLLGAVLGYWRVIGMTMTAGERVVDAIKRVVVYAPVPLGTIDPRLADLDVRMGDDGQLHPNRNPLLTGVEIRADEPDGATVERVKPGGTYWLRPRYDDRELQAYWSLKVDLAGLDLEDPASLRELSDEELLARFERVRRCEIPVFSWYVTDGALRRETTVDERVVGTIFEERGESCPPVEGEARRPEVRFTAPEGDDVPDDGVVRAWVVLRDGRGGTDWRAFDIPIDR